jgi:hypothetical protein
MNTTTFLQLTWLLTTLTIKVVIETEFPELRIVFTYASVGSL